MRVRFTLFAVLLALSLQAACAQSTIHLFASHGKPANAECQAEAAMLTAALGRYPHPARWTYIVACDEQAWHLVLTHLGLQNQTTEAYGETDISPGVELTYLRGSAWLLPPSPEVTADHVIAHELAHAVLATGDEQQAEAQARTWLGQQQRTVVITKGPKF
jgi:hypothetical protein